MIWVGADGCRSEEHGVPGNPFQECRAEIRNQRGFGAVLILDEVEGDRVAACGFHSRTIFLQAEMDQLLSGPHAGNPVRKRQGAGGRESSEEIHYQRSDCSPKDMPAAHDGIVKMR